MRYGVLSDRGKYGWATVDGPRISFYFQIWDASATHTNFVGQNFKNYVKAFGWICELDPYARATAKKRTALGRLNHRGAAPGTVKVGERPAFYLPDDGVNEYLYKFVSATAWTQVDAAPADPEARASAGDRYLDAGTLYVAQFEASGSGRWLPLKFGTAPLDSRNSAYPFESQADVLINARLAADALGATPMDRPGSATVSPSSGEVFFSLEGSPRRAVTNAPNPRPANSFGHLIRIREAGGSGEALTFQWDLPLFGAADSQPAETNVSGLTTENSFTTPRNLSFSQGGAPFGGKPLLFISTADSTGRSVSNNSLLVAVPGSVGDGGARVIEGQASQVGKKLDASTLRRFLTAPKEANIGGSTLTPDGRTLFVAIQFPGRSGTSLVPTSHWPDTQTSGQAAPTIRPRSAIVVITKADGGVIGLP